jgi:hypothetical protein
MFFVAPASCTTSSWASANFSQTAEGDDLEIARLIQRNLKTKN